MNKILIKNAILQENIYLINNNYEEESEFHAIKGRIKFLSFRKFKLENKNNSKEIREEFFDNIIGELEIEYTNLNTYANSDTILESFYLTDLDDFSFDTITDPGVIFKINEQVGRDWYVGDFIPKIKKKTYIYFLIPDEETDYYFGVEDGRIEEI